MLGPVEESLNPWVPGDTILVVPSTRKPRPTASGTGMAELWRYR